MRRTICFLLATLFFGPIAAIGQTITSNGTGGGAWNNAATWSGGVIPNSGNSTQIRIVSGDAVNVPSGFSVQIDEAQVRQNATLTIDAGGVVDVVDAPGKDLSMYTSGGTGQLIVDGTIELSQSATIVNFDGSVNTDTDATTVTVNSGGIYRHKYTTGSGSILGASWQAGSTVEITGYTSNTGRPSNLNQSFHHFIWDCQNQTGTINLKGALTDINGDLTVLSTGGATPGVLRFFYSESNITLDVTGNINISGQSGVWFAGTGTNNIINATDVIIDSPVEQSLTRDGTLTLNCNDIDVQDASGGLRLAATSPGVCTVNLTGDLNITGALSSIPSFVNFVGASPVVQVVSGAGTVGNINWTIISGAIVDIGTSSFRGQGLFTMASGAELRVGSTHANGAIQNSVSNGNIIIDVGKRTYNQESTIRYNGVATQQMSTGHPFVNTIIDNSVTLFNNNLVFNDLTIETGTFNAGDKLFTMQRDLVLENGDLTQGSNGTTIFAGTTDIQLNGTGVLTLGNMTINAAATLNMPTGNVNVRRYMTITAGATFDANGGTVTYNGGTNQEMRSNGYTLDNFTINKTGGSVSVPSALNMAGVLLLQSNTTLNTNGNITLLSTDDSPATDGSFGPVAAGATIVGNVIVQRFITAEGTINRYISAPISNASVAQLQDDFTITGNFPQSDFPCTGCTNNGPSLLWYDEPALGGAQSRYKQYPITTNTENLQVGRGYLAYMWENNQVNWDLTGTINRGDISMPVSHSVSTPPRAQFDGWNLVGNPYPSAIIWDDDASPGWTITNISTTISVPDNSSGSTVFQSYNSFDGSGSLTNGIIARGQSFWAYAPVGGSSLMVHELAKSTLGSGTFYRSAKPLLQQLQITLSGDETVVSTFLKINSHSTEGFDMNFDAFMLPVENVNIALVDNAGHDLLMHTVPELNDLTIPLTVKTGVRGDYSINFKDTNVLGVTTKLYFIDSKLNEAFEIKANSSYRFTAESENEIMSDRFYVTTSPEKDLSEAKSELEVRVYPNPVKDVLTIELDSDQPAELTIYSSMGQSIRASEFTRKEVVNMEAVQAGVYLVRVRTAEGSFTRKITKP